MGYFFFLMLFHCSFSKVIQQMTNSNPRLLLREHTYYIRVAIPRGIQYLAKRKEYRYSLETKDYYLALSKLRAESFKIDLYIEFMKGLDMEIKEGRVLLTDTEIDQMLVYIPDKHIKNTGKFEKKR